LHHRKALCLFRLDLFEESANEFDSIITIDKGHALAYYGRAKAFFKMEGGAIPTIVSLDKFLELMVDFFTNSTAYSHISSELILSDAFLDLGVCYHFIKDWDSSISFLDNMITLEVKEHLPYAFYYRGKCFIGKSEWNLAIQSFTKAIELEPKLIESYRERAKAFQNSGMLEEAKNDEEKFFHLFEEYKQKLTNSLLEEPMKSTLEKV